MIIRTLRKKNGWSQEELAEICGLNVRTIQRVESGNKASLETLRSLASVFDVELSELTEEITVIDKTSEEWKSLPWWFRANMYGVRKRRTALVIELLLLVCGAIGWLISGDAYFGAVFFLSAYLTGWIVRYGDARKAWSN
jgi:transcriptional regulator with XRE-family HTH domain